MFGTAIVIFSHLNSYTFHINLYDLASLGTIFIGLNFAVLLAFVKSINRSANRFLSLALFTMILWMMRILAIDLHLQTYLPGWDRMPMQFLLALGPLIYFYVLKITRPEYQFCRKDLLHFSPLLLELIALVPERIQSMRMNLATYDTPVFQQLNPILQLLIFISMMIYLYRSHQLIQNFYRRLQPVMMDRSRLEFRWLRRLLAATSSLWLLWIVYAAVDYFGYRNQLALNVYYPFYIFFAVIIIWTAAAAFLKPGTGTKVQPSPAIKLPPPAEFKEKGTWLKRKMEIHLYYQDPELSVSSLAEELGMPPHELSRIINTALKKNFHDFINEYRVAEVIQRMQDPVHDHITLLGIAYDSGFNSKSTFNRIFKEMTGKSPTEYKTGLKKEFPTYKLGRHPRFASVISNHEITQKWSQKKLNRNYMFRNYFKIAYRNLWRNKAFSAINIAGLSVGLACCMLVFLYTMDEVSYDRFNVNADNIYRLVVNKINPTGVESKIASTGSIHGPSFKKQIPEIEDFVRTQSASFTVKRGSEVFNEDALYADSNFFSVFTVPIQAGNYKDALSGDNSMVLSEDLAKKYFGEQNPMGKTLDLKVGDKFQPFVVTAVTKRSPQNSSIKIKMLLPFKASSAYDDDKWLNFYLNTFFTVRPGADIKRVEAKMTDIYNKDAAGQIEEASDKYDYKGKIRYILQPLLAMHTSLDYPVYSNGHIDNTNPIYFRILDGISLFILLIACINFVNLTVARSLKRAKEIGIRKVVGGQRKQLIIQFLGESYILSFIAFILAIGLAQLALPIFNGIANKALSFSYLLSFKLVFWYIAVFLFTGMLAGFYPAMVLSEFSPVQTLYNRQKNMGKNYLSKSLVVLQFTLATFFIIATITIYSQFDYLVRFDLGYNDKNVVAIKALNTDRKLFPLFKTELLKNPEIKMVTADQGSGRWSALAKINDGQQTNFDFKHVDEDYLPLFQIPVVKGRNFSKDMVSDSANSILVNESFVKQAEWKNPIGQEVDFFYMHKKYTVVGVVKDYHFLDLTQKVSPELFRMKPDDPWGNLFVKIGDQNKATTLNYIERTFKRFFPFKPYQYNFKDAQNAEQYDKEAKWKQIITFSAILTIFISCIGLFGLATLSAERRKKEIGIRKILGASIEGIVRKLSTDILKLVILSALIASPVAWWVMYKWLEDYPYKIAINAWIFLGAVVFVLLIALITVSFQTIRAALTNPVMSLRSE